MFRALLRELIRIRPIQLTDLADLAPEVRVWLLDKLGRHETVHQMCPRWCPCGHPDLDDDDLDDDPDGDLEGLDDCVAAAYRWTAAA